MPHDNAPDASPNATPAERPVMSLDLDKRQRAMLREMGVRLWQAPGVAAETAPPHVAAPRPSAATRPTAAALVTPPAATAAAAATPAAPSPADSVWALGAAQALYPPAASAGDGEIPGAAARWLLLIETPAGSTTADPFAGETGKLLDNMLRAAGLPHSARAAWAPVSRQAASAGPADGAAGQPLQNRLIALVQAENPVVVLIMGRLAAQALLQTAEPLGKLRGQRHLVAGVPAFVTYEAAYLLRSLPDKARAWDDLCLAQAIAGAN
jgi:uracil-DNA glycosylase family 4